MPIHRWHYGKMVLLWGWTVVGIGMALVTIEQFGGEGGRALGLVSMLFVFTLALGMSVVTWKWLNGKEKREEPDKS